MHGAVLRCAGSAMIWLLRHFRQLPADFTLQEVVRDHPDVLRRNDGLQPIYRLLNQCAFSKETKTCFAFRLRLRGQKRVPRPPAIIRPYR